MTKWGLKLYFKHNFYILTITGQALIFKLFHTLWGFMGYNQFQYKNDISNIHSHKCHWSDSFIRPSKFSFDGKGLNNMGIWFKRFLRFSTNHLNIHLLICLVGPRFSKKNKAHYKCTATIPVLKIILIPHVKVFRGWGLQSGKGCFSKGYNARRDHYRFFRKLRELKDRVHLIPRGQNLYNF